MYSTRVHLTTFDLLPVRSRQFLIKVSEKKRGVPIYGENRNMGIVRD